MGNLLGLAKQQQFYAGNKATAKVKARYEVRSDRRIALTFVAAEVSDVQIGRRVESLLAPALLPRTWLTQQLLVGIKEV